MKIYKNMMVVFTVVDYSSMVQVIMLVSLFGWEHLALPYMVVGKNANVCSSPRSPPDKEEEVVILNFSSIGQIFGTHEIRVIYYLILVLLFWIASYVELVLGSGVSLQYHDRWKCSDWLDSQS